MMLRRLLLTSGCLSLFAVPGTFAYYYEGVPRYQRPEMQRLSFVRPLRGPASGPLHRDARNPRYFADAQQRTVLLAGAHTWANFQDNGVGETPPPFDYDAYLDFLAAHNLNFMRLWSWEQSRWAPWVTTDNYFFSPGPAYRRTGPGIALDGQPRFNLDSLDPAYFDRLRSRVSLAAQRGIYVSIMLFNGWSIDDAHAKLYRGNPWHGHPFNTLNNVSGVDGDPDANDAGEETHELRVPRITAYQDAYVRRVVDAVNEFDNVLFEISNESYASSRDWQYHMIDLIHRYERTKPKQHPVGMSQYQWPGRNADLFDGPADWIAPWEELPAYPYRDDPRVSDGRKVVIVDTDHLWGIGGDRAWAWKTFLRGNQPSFMDAYDGEAVGSGAPQRWDIRLASWREIAKDVLRRTPRPSGWDPNAEQWVSLRRNLGYIRDYAQRVNLAALQPRGDLVSTHYALAAFGDRAEVLAYLPDTTRSVDVDLTGMPVPLEQEWFDTRTGSTIVGDLVDGGGRRHLASPFAGESVLYLRAHRKAVAQ